MKYFYKAVSTNTRDFKTGLLVVVEGSSYLFNVPDGFQRLILSNKINLMTSTGAAKYVFLSSLNADHFGGFPAYYLSTRMAIE